VGGEEHRRRDFREVVSGDEDFEAGRTEMVMRYLRLEDRYALVLVAI
jgi:hypothetical protein